MASATYSMSEVRKHNSRGDAWVVYAGDVCDVSSFITFHPGGDDLLLKWAGRDVTRMVHSNIYHEHSERARSFLLSLKIGELKREDVDVRPTWEERIEEAHDLNNNFTTAAEKCDGKDRVCDTVNIGKEGDYTPGDSDIEGLVDWSRGMVSQVHKLGSHYNDWVHRPVGRDIRMFDNEYIERYLTKNSWYTILIVWLPVVVIWTYHNLQTVAATSHIRLLGITTTSVTAFTILFTSGLVFWTIMEYCLHRSFHIQPPADSPVLVTVHFLAHGIHHKCPYDAGRLVFPPILSMNIILSVYLLTRTILPSHLAGMFVTGAMLGYILYDLTHYYLHFGMPRWRYFKELKLYHARHHFVEHELGFGIWHKLWDHSFRTLLDVQP